MPNHRITSGIIASAGMLRTICTVESSAISAGLKSPVASPSTKPMPPPIAKPDTARHVLTFTSAHISPDWISDHAAFTTASGSGSTRVDSTPLRAASSHANRISNGTIHGANRRAKRLSVTPPDGRGPALMETVDMDNPPSALRRLRQIVIPDDLAERPRQRTVAAFCSAARQEREHEFGESIRLFEM